MKRIKKRVRVSHPKKAARSFKVKSPFAMVCYGPSGVGKSSLAANFPRVGFIIDPQERGIQELVDFNQVPSPVFIREVSTFPDLLKAVGDCSKSPSRYKIETLAVDSLTGVEALCFRHHCEKYFDGDWSDKGFYAYQRGPKNAAKTDWPRFLEALDNLREAGVNVLLIAHSQIRTYSNPDGADYDRFTPYLDKETWTITHRWAGAILFLNYHVEVAQRDPKTGKRILKAKPQTATESRFCYTVWSPAFDAKNRWGLSPLIDMGDSGEEAFANFRDAYLKASH